MVGLRGGWAAGPGWPLGTSLVEGLTTPDRGTRTQSQSANLAAPGATAPSVC